MYWLTEDMLASWQHAVMSFDLREESFAKIQLPAEREDHDRYGPRKFWIRDIDGKICIVTAQTSRYDPRALLGELQIWTLDNTVEQQRWSQKYNIKHTPNYIPGPHFVHRDRILAQLCSNNVCSCELFGENFDVNQNVYKKAGIVRRPKQREGWELKKWETWKCMLGKDADMRSQIHKFEHDLLELAETSSKMCKFLQNKQYNIAEHVLTELNQVLQRKPDNPDQPLSIRRLNWVGSRIGSSRS
uniref:Uncharacterized protein n=1 Tax=Aegilops tauschii subsp. strangulata TaxID=200361 RepID=A0A453L2B1_AEGTS